MRLVLAVNPPRDIVIQATPEACLADVLVAAGLDVDARDAWWVDGTRVDVATPLSDVVLVDGTVLAPAPTRPVLRHAGGDRGCPTADGAVVTVVAGIGSGTCRVAPPGRAVEVGRDERAGVRLASDTVSARHLRLVTSDHDVVVEDHGSRNGTWVDGEALTAHEPTRFALPVTLRVGACVLRVAPTAACDRPVGPRGRDAGAHWSVDRPPRSALPAPVDPVDVPRPPEPGSRARALRWAAVLAPLAMGGVMIAMTGRVEFALFALLSPVVGIATWWSDRRRDRGDRRAAGAAWEVALDRFRSDLDTARRATAARLEAVHPDLGEVVRQATGPSTRLWERRLDHADALVLRLGSADRVVDLPLRRHDDGVPPAERSEVDRSGRARLADLVAEHSRLPTSPLPLALDRTPVVGLVGHRPTALGLARALVAQLATFHGPADLPLAVLVAPDHRPDWDWAKWLPHVEVDGRRLVAAERDAVTDVVAVLAARHAATGRPNPGNGPTTAVVVDDVGLVTGPDASVRDLLRSAHGTVVAVVVAEHVDRLPASCAVVVTCHPDETTTVVEPATTTDAHPDVLPATLDRASATGVAHALAHLLDPERPDAEASLPSMVPLGDLLDPATGSHDADGPTPGGSGGPPDRGGSGPGPAACPDPTDGGTRLATPLGRDAGGTTWIDLVTDGPHALVGGTTGSGKSELLRSLVAGLATRHTPDQVVFVLVDYKGGAAFRECADLPHTVGLVTDLDDHLGARALASLDAELRHREQVLAGAGADDLPGYVTAGSPDGPLPRLVVVIDEFATLAAELPDFLDALVGVAQRGRSLGIHLVLATQRPRGSVDANVRANTNLRIALRVQDAADSQDIVDEVVAAEIPRRLPGRAWVRRGHGDLVAVQTALASAPRRETAAPVRLAPFRFAPTSPLPDPGVGGDDPTDLSTLVAAARARHRCAGTGEPRRPWLPMLGTDLALLDLLGADGPPDTSAGTGVVLGVADLPRDQAQRVARWDLDASSLTAIGPVGSGTTTVLCTIAASAALANDPDDLHLYGIDAGGGGLAHLRTLPHVGAVLGIDQVDEHAHLVGWLAGEVRRRQALAVRQRADLPRLVLVLDNLAAFLAVHDGRASREVVDHLATVLDDGPPMGVATAVATERVAGLTGALRSGLGRRLVLGHPDDRDLSLVGLRPGDLPPAVPGRALDVTTGEVLQVARVAESDDVTGLVAHRGGATAVRRPPHRIHGLPERLDLASLPTPTGPRPLVLPIGVDRTGEPRSVVLYPGDHLTIAGPSRSGRTTALQVLSARLRQALPDAIQVALCDVDRSALHGWPSLDAAGSTDGLTRVLAAGVARDDPWFVLVDDIRWCGDDDLLADLVAARADLHLVVAGRPDELRGGFGAWQRDLRTSRTGILLQPDLAMDGDLLGATLPRHLRTPPGPGRGFVVNAGDAELTQLADAPSTPPRGSIGT